MDDDLGPDIARRCWFYGRGQWGEKRLVKWGTGDEFGNSTVGIRLPGGRAFIFAWNFPLRRELEPNEGHVEYGIRGDYWPDSATPLPVKPEDRFDVPEGYHLVYRVTWTKADPWQRWKEPS